MSFIKYLYDEINEVRTDPSNYADKVIKCASYFDGKIMKVPGTNFGIETEEGVAAFKECEEYLRNFDDALDDVKPSKGLTKVANDFLNKIIKLDPSEFKSVKISEIIAKYGTFFGKVIRLIEMGGITPDQVIIDLLVGDGDKTRHQRNALLNPDFKRVGIAFGNHPTYGECSVIVLCEMFENIVDKDDSEDYEGPESGPEYIPPGGYDL